MSFFSALKIPPNQTVTKLGGGPDYAVRYNGFRKLRAHLNLATPRALDKIVKVGEREAKEITRRDPRGRHDTGKNANSITSGRPKPGSWAVWGRSGYSLYIEEGTGRQNITGRGNPAINGRFAAPTISQAAGNIGPRARRIILEELIS